MPVRFTVDSRKLDAKLRKAIQRNKNPFSFFKRIAPIYEKDQLDHFAKKRGPSGPWQELTKKYLEQKIKKTGASDILVLSGKLRRQSTKTKISKFAVEIKPTVEYAITHQEGFRPQNIPARPFLWLSKRATKEILTEARRFFLQGR